MFTTIDSLIPSLKLGLVSFSSLALLSTSSSVVAQEDSSCSPEVNGAVRECLTIDTPKAGDPGKFSTGFKILKDDGRVRRDIKVSNLKVSVNGVPQNIKPSQLKEYKGKGIPLRVVILLDYSGSMKDKDAGGKTKLEGAANGIQTFINQFPVGADVKVSVIPFAIANPDPKKCRPELHSRLLFNKNGRQEINSKLLADFYSPDLANLQNIINNLGNVNTLCADASTNLFEATAIALDFLSQRNNKDLYPYAEDDEVNKSKNPKLILVVLTDGFNTERLAYKADLTEADRKDNVTNRCSYNESDLKALKSQYIQTNKNQEIKIFTVGYYGEAYKNVRSSGEITCGDYGTKGLKASQFVDEKALQEIAKSGRGFPSVGGTAEGINKIFEDIYETISGGYDIEFFDLKADAGDKRTVEISVDIGDSRVLKASKDYTIPAYQKVEAGDRTLLFFIILACLILGGIPFSMWRSGLDSD